MLRLSHGLSGCAPAASSITAVVAVWCRSVGSSATATSESPIEQPTRFLAPGQSGLPLVRVQPRQPRALENGRVIQVHRHAQCPETLHALELAQVQLFHLAGEVAQALEVLDVPTVLAALGALAVDDRDLAGLGYAV